MTQTTSYAFLAGAPHLTTPMIVIEGYVLDLLTDLALSTLYADKFFTRSLFEGFLYVSNFTDSWGTIGS
jgi:hypothetical protein